MTDSAREALRRAGVELPDGAKVLAAKLPRAPKPAKSLVGVKLAPGVLVVEVIVNARPIPWKAPTVTRSGHSFKDRSLLRWQDEVRKAAETAMAGMSPYGHAVRVDFLFELRRIKGRTLPDTSNLTKSTEDALQRIVITNDRNVLKNCAVRVVGEVDRATIQIFAAEGS